jgi:hypothetical protein
MTLRDDRSGETRGETRSSWIEQELGDEWVAQGDGTYRFVGPGTDAPIARDDSHPNDDEVVGHISDEPMSREHRFPRLPWRRH